MMTNKLDQLIEKMIVKSDLQQIVPAWIKSYWQRQAVHAALTRAYAAWATHYWEWVDYSFNEHFLTHQVFPYLIHCREVTSQPDPAELVERWAEQFTWFDAAMRQTHTAKLIPAATRFLDCLETELRACRGFQANFADPTQETHDKVVDRSSATILAQSVTIL